MSDKDKIEFDEKIFEKLVSDAVKSNPDFEYDIVCPHCGEHIRAKLGNNICEHCGNLVTLGLGSQDSET